MYTMVRKPRAWARVGGARLAEITAVRSSMSVVVLTEHVRACHLTWFLQQLHEVMWWIFIVFVCPALFSHFWLRAPIHTHPAPSFRNLLSPLSQCGSDGHYQSHKPLLTLCHREAHDPGQARLTAPFPRQ